MTGEELAEVLYAHSAFESGEAQVAELPDGSRCGKIGNKNGISHRGSAYGGDGGCNTGHNDCGEHDAADKARHGLAGADVRSELFLSERSAGEICGNIGDGTAHDNEYDEVKPALGRSYFNYRTQK